MAAVICMRRSHRRNERKIKTLFRITKIWSNHSFYHMCFVIFIHYNVIFIYSFILRVALTCFCTWNKQATAAQRELNPYASSFYSCIFCRWQVSPQCVSLFPLPFILHLRCSFSETSMAVTIETCKTPYLSTMLAPVASHAIILSRSLAKRTPTICAIRWSAHVILSSVFSILVNQALGVQTHTYW